MPKKDPAPIAKKVTSNVTALQPFINNAFVAGNATNGLSGDVRMSKNVTSFPGFNFGSKKATRSGGFQNFPATAPSKLSKSKIIGFLKFQNQSAMLQKSNTLFMTALILEKTTVSSP